MRSDVKNCSSVILTAPQLVFTNRLRDSSYECEKISRKLYEVTQYREELVRIKHEIIGRNWKKIAFRSIVRRFSVEEMI